MVRDREECRQRIGGRPIPTRMIAASVTVRVYSTDVELAIQHATANSRGFSAFKFSQSSISSNKQLPRTPKTRGHLRRHKRTNAFAHGKTRKNNNKLFNKNLMAFLVSTQKLVQIGSRQTAFLQLLQ